MRNRNLTFVLCYVVPVKSKVKISQKFLAFSEYTNFNGQIYGGDFKKYCDFLRIYELYHGSPVFTLWHHALKNSINLKKNYRKNCFIFQAMSQKKKSRLVEQLNEADILHQNTDRRASQVRQMLSKYSKDQSEFDTFLVDLIKHITDLKETEQRIQLGEEQLVALNDNLISLP